MSDLPPEAEVKRKTVWIRAELLDLPPDAYGDVRVVIPHAQPHGRALIDRAVEQGIRYVDPQAIVDLKEGGRG